MSEGAASAAKAEALVLVGCGQMGAAMLRGWLARGAASKFIVIEPAGLPPVFADTSSVEWHAAAGELPDALTPDAVVFAVKPQVINEVLPAYARWVRPQTVFLSIAAGITISGIIRHLGAAAIIRTMPNTPAAIGRGITVACANPRVTPEQRRLCETLLAAIGESAWVEDEALLDPVTAVSGSGPAYVFLLIEVLAQAGERAGLPADLALRLARETVAGSGELARRSPGDPARLREAVMSPGGTTRAALDVLMARGGLAQLIDKAVTAATKRSRELAS
ncbi:MAG: pyrroline-5-carboxylate reductase [Alphaproteobacteria bacterium]|nr:pyrroline-5-carboxylate reductase [Alphaproteobacteria bacterium]MBV9151283.1 pyrroline-5-carboxylate reductase [Alphaproteobacteria bacterium]MBV9586822.1 pyrroline-5-carboxylate reductase [Alphaproteobacteria bacterium]MBV9964906.1 pyrroline-5-carboxylate reductase [Alphaproteobacteria bacterium]